MNEADKDSLRTRILDELVELRVKIGELEEAAKPIAPDKALGRLTRLEAMQDRSVAEAALERAVNERTRLENALQNLVLPTFGTCQNCGEAISMDRLEALPQSTLCIACAAP